MIKGNRSKAFYTLCVFGSLLVLYAVIIFFYLKIVGVFGVASIKEAVATSDGVMYKYEFVYDGGNYTGVFTGAGGYRTGDKYFVSFSRTDPSKNLLQYNSPVPDCFKDSINSFWEKLPICP